MIRESGPLEVKIVDFGLACGEPSSQSFTCKSSKVGSPGFIDPYLQRYNQLTLEKLKWADWWAYGQLLVLLFTYRGLWDGTTFHQLTRTHASSAVPLFLIPLLEGLTDPNRPPQDRPDQDEILDTLIMDMEV